MKVLLVCSGNTCRSPMAAAILRDLGGERGVDVRSAGASAEEGAPASVEAVRVATRHGLSLETHRSRPLTREDVEWANHVLAMEAWQKRVVERMGSPEKVTLLSEYGGDGRDIPDPFGHAEDAYERVFESLQRYLESFLATEDLPKT